jgi:hypothetical protein
MSAIERDFSNFHLGDNVYELAGGVIPEIAAKLGVELGDEPSSEALGELVGKIGKNKVLRENEDVEAIDRETAADFVDRSGVQKALSRSLWTPEPFRLADMDAIVMTGGMANWQDRMVTRLSTFYTKPPIFYVTGQRIMGSPTEVTNKNVIELQKDDQYPTESEYAAKVIVPKLIALGNKETTLLSYPTENGDELAARLFEDQPDLAGQNLLFARVANAGIQLAVQMRKAARQVNPDFDSFSNIPQAFVLTDDFRQVARTAEEDKDSQHFQKAHTALRQVAVTAKMLHEAATQ